MVEKGDGLGPVLVARGIFEGRWEADDAGVGTPWVMLDFGVAANANLSFSFSIGAGTEVVSVGVGGCSSELVKDVDPVRLGAVS
jgi:hypothetical protein